jgi:hypothetical protein
MSLKQCLGLRTNFEVLLKCDVLGVTFLRQKWSLIFVYWIYLVGRIVFMKTWHTTISYVAN